MPKNFKDYLLLLLPALFLFVALARYLNFTQDDAFISYRYVANFLGGHGLVYNIGERIEGFTNFGWVVYMIFAGGLGLGYILVSKITGLALGAGVIVMTYHIARLVFEGRSKLPAILAAYLVAINLSLAYWSPAGLETSAFAFVTSLSLYWFLKRSHLLIAGLVLAVWIRPEGAVIAGLLIMCELILERRLPLYSLRCVLAALVLSLPFVVFKVVYYGSVLPNPFFAKTSLSSESLGNGLGYAWEFLYDYGLGGVGILISLLLFRRLTGAKKAVLIFMLGYLGYVVLIGGDVLKVHRFFVPVMGLSVIILFTAVQAVVNRQRGETPILLLILPALLVAGLTVWLPYKTVTKFNRTERAFTIRMKALAEDLKQTDTTAFSVAVPTIGVFGYTLLGHTIIDMVGLTDSTIARYSEEPVPGMVTTWKERKHNSEYLLRRAPDYVAFSTGVKPSAPAEKALMMYGSFQKAYRTIGWYFADPLAAPRGITLAAFKRVRPIVGPFVPNYPLQYVDDLKLGIEFAGENNAKAVQVLEDAIRVAGRLEPSPELLYTLGYSYGALRGSPLGLACLNRAIAIDSLAFSAHRDLFLYETAVGDMAGATLHREYVKRISPWYVPHLDSMAARAISRPGSGADPQ